MKRITTLLSLAFILSAASTQAVDKKITRDQMVCKDIADVGKIEEWIYNDLDKAIAEARRTKKPLMIVFRCIP
jgi:hypothetical protein